MAEAAGRTTSGKTVHWKHGIVEEPTPSLPQPPSHSAVRGPRSVSRDPRTEPFGKKTGPASHRHHHQQENTVSRTQADGRTLQEKTDGRTLQHQTDGRTRQHQTDGRTLQDKADSRPLQHQTDGKTLQHQTDGKTLQHQTDGSILQHQTDGRTRQHQTDGRTLQDKADGRTLQDKADGRTLQHQTDGKTLQHQTDGKTLQHQTDGSILQHQTDGRTRQHQTDGRTLQDKADGRTLQDKADGRTLQHQTDGRTLQHQTDGRTLQHQTDGRTLQHQTDGRTLQDKADGRTLQDKRAAAEGSPQGKICSQGGTLQTRHEGRPQQDSSRKTPLHQRKASDPQTSDSWGDVDEDGEEACHDSLHRREGESHLQHVDRILWGNAASHRASSKLLRLSSYPSVGGGHGSPRVFERDMFLFSPLGSVRSSEGEEEDALLRSSSESELAFDLDSVGSESATIRTAPAVERHVPQPTEHVNRRHLSSDKPPQQEPSEPSEEPEQRQGAAVRDQRPWKHGHSTLSKRGSITMFKPTVEGSGGLYPGSVTSNADRAGRDPTSDHKLQAAPGPGVLSVDRDVQTTSRPVETGVQPSCPPVDTGVQTSSTVLHLHPVLQSSSRTKGQPNAHRSSAGPRHPAAEPREPRALPARPAAHSSPQSPPLPAPVSPPPSPHTPPPPHPAVCDNTDSRDAMRQISPTERVGRSHVELTHFPPHGHLPAPTTPPSSSSQPHSGGKGGWGRVEEGEGPWGKGRGAVSGIRRDSRADSGKRAPHTHSAVPAPSHPHHPHTNHTSGGAGERTSDVTQLQGALPSSGGAGAQSADRVRGVRAGRTGHTQHRLGAPLPPQQTEPTADGLSGGTRHDEPDVGVSQAHTLSHGRNAPLDLQQQGAANRTGLTARHHAMLWQGPVFYDKHGRADTRGRDMKGRHPSHSHDHPSRVNPHRPQSKFLTETAPVLRQDDSLSDTADMDRPRKPPLPHGFKPGHHSQSTSDVSSEDSQTDPEEHRLRKSLRELSAKIQLKKLERELVRTRSGIQGQQQGGAPSPHGETRPLTHHTQHDPREQRTSTLHGGPGRNEDTAARRNTSVPRQTDTGQGMNRDPYQQHPHPKHGDHTANPSDSYSRTQGDSLRAKRGDGGVDVLAVPDPWWAGPADPSGRLPGAGDPEDEVSEDWSFLDDVDLQEEYGGGDSYVFYLQTQGGSVVGPLRFDVQDIEMGLPGPMASGSGPGPEGLRNRQTGSHGLNEFSSRSHSVLTVTIDSETQPEPEDENLYVTKRGKLSFVDLAGSEKVKDASGGAGGSGMMESNSINKSLLVLGNCISHLGDAKRRQGHIPYRDSKLTKLLSDSLGGNGITLMVACITPSSSNLTETMNTLRYASRAKKIKSKPTVKMDPREKLIVNLKREIKVLRNENHYLRQQLDFPAKPKGQLQKENDEKFMKFMKEQKEKESGLYEMLQEYMVENENLRAENSEMHSMRDRIRREQQLLYRENEKLMKRVEEMERVMTQNPGLWSMQQQPKRTDGYGHYDLVSPRNSPVGPPPPAQPGFHSGHKHPSPGPAAFGSPPSSRGKAGNPPGPMRPPHRLPDPVMRPAQRPAELVETSAVYAANNGYASPRAALPRQTSPARSMERRASQMSTTDAIHSMNEQLKREVMQLEGQIRHHQYVHDRSSDVARSNGSNSVR